MTTIDDATLAKPAGLQIPKGKVSAFVRELAAHHDVVYVQTASDRQCDDFARLSDSEVRFDEAELLIIALARANIITHAEKADLHDAYIRRDLGLS